MSDDQAPEPSPGAEPQHRATERPPVPSAMGALFALAFLVGMGFNLYYDRNATVTIFLGSATLLTLGIDVGRITGRK